MLCGGFCRRLGKLAVSGKYSWSRTFVGFRIREDFLEVFFSLLLIVFFEAFMLFALGKRRRGWI